MQSLAVDTSNTDGVDAVGVAIKVAVIIVGGTVANGEDVN